MDATLQTSTPSSNDIDINNDENDDNNNTITSPTPILDDNDSNNNTPTSSPPLTSISTFIKSKKAASTSTSPPKSSFLSIGTRRATLKTSTELSEPEQLQQQQQQQQQPIIDESKLTIKSNSIIQHIVDVKWRDKYGFISEDFFVPELKKFEAQEEELAQEKMLKWSNFHEQYKHVGLSSNPKKLCKLLSKGIPHSSRGSLWKVYSGSFEKQRKEELQLFKQQKEEKLQAKNNRNGLYGTIRGLTPPTNRKSYYLHLQSIIKTSNRMSTRFQSLPEIDKDISRTFPGHPFFDSDEGKRKLSRVLQAYSIRNRKVGYCQSMNIVAGFVLFVGKGNEEDAFWILSTIVEDYCQNYYSTNLMGSQVDMSVFSNLVAQYFPKLFNHMQEYDVSLSLLSTKWFMCLFVNVLPTEIVLRVWDHLFVECGIYGYHKPSSDEQWLCGNGNGSKTTTTTTDTDKTFRCLGLASYNLLLTGLSVLAYFETTLLNCHSTPHLLMILSTHAKGLFNAKEFFGYYQKLRDTIPEDSFNELKKVCELQFLRELEDMRKARDLHQTSKLTRFSKSDLEKIWSGFRQLEISSRYSMGKSMILDYKMFQNVFQFILPTTIGSGTADELNTRDIIIKQLFKAFDKNKDGTLDFTELMSGLCILAKGTSEERLKLYFSFFDNDSTGFISKNDMKLMLENVYDKIELDPLAVTQYSIDEYVEMIFSNYSIPDGEGLSFDMFRQAIASYPRIFKCFMIEEETFSIEDFEDIYNDKQASSSSNDTGSTAVKRKATKGSRIKFQEVLSRESELENSCNSGNNVEETKPIEDSSISVSATTTEVIDTVIDVKEPVVEVKEDENEDNEEEVVEPTTTTISKSGSRIGFNNLITNKKQQTIIVQSSNEPPSKASTFNSSTLMDAIEKAKSDKPQPNIIIEMNSNNYSTTTISTSLTPQQQQQQQQQQGNPLSCCKFM